MEAFENDVRWEQRFDSFKKALKKLKEIIDDNPLEDKRDVVRMGLIKSFELCYELAWKTLQDFLKSRDYLDIIGPNAVLTQSLLDNLIEDEIVWRRIHKSRNLSSHLYNEDIAQDIAKDIVNQFYGTFFDLQIKLETQKLK